MSLKQRARGYRLAETYLGDTIQMVAMRELGAADRWPELVAYNGLAPPYLVDSLQGIEESGDAGTVLLAGMHMRVPAMQPENEVSSPDDIFGTDIELGQDGFLSASAGGDLQLVEDLPNLSQALRLRLGTYQNELVWHPMYGNPLFKLIGQKPDAVTLQYAAALGERTLRSDPRIDSIARIESFVGADAVGVDATAITVDGRPLPVRSDR
jgi:hypothetical protein